MGLRDKYAKKIEEQGFRPIDLNEDNVQAIFERCLITEQTTDTIGTSIMDVELGLLNKHIPVLFDKKKIGQERKKPFNISMASF